MIWTLILGVGILIVLGYGLALLYHWIRFGFLYPLVFVALPVWGIGTFILFSLTLAAFAAIV